MCAPLIGLAAGAIGGYFFSRSMSRSGSRYTGSMQQTSAPVATPKTISDVTAELPKMPEVPEITANRESDGAGTAADDEVVAARRRQVQQMALAKGIGSTINTSAIGDTSMANIKKKTLGGV